VAILNLTTATTTTPAGGSSYIREVTRDRPITGLFEKTCTGISMKATMHGP
jgi:hypothetical protein